MQHKHSHFLFALTLILMLPLQAFAQSTEGTDFWVTLMRADADSPTKLMLTISAKEAANVTIENTYTGYSQTKAVAAGGIETELLYEYDQKNKVVLSGNRDICYVGTADNKKITDKALHVTSDKPISLIAANYRDKSFDVAAILPTAALGVDYRIQCYTPADHESKYQGSHFAVVATDDNTLVQCVLSIVSDSIKGLQTRKDNGYTLTEDELAYLDAHKDGGDTITTAIMKKGQVYYYWSGNGKGDDYDLSGTRVMANKPVAVFNGNPHTNIPDGSRDRDQIYSQAMPTPYWGTQFAVASSLTTIKGQTGNWERIDKVRIMALEDGTTVKVDGNVVYTFDFSTNPKHFYEFDFGAKDAMTNYTTPSGMPYFEGASHYISTSCPCAVHQFFTSNRYDHEKIKSVNEEYCNGDPAELWVNPIEEQIEEITFGTFQTAQVQTHFLNIVTATTNVASMTLDGADISSNFATLNGNAAYSFARMNITNATHTLKGDAGFIANVYGFGEKESYAYPAGGKTIPLEQAVTINGKVFTPTSQETLCSLDTVHFALALNYDVKKIVWGYGDGTPAEEGVITHVGDSVKSKSDHYYVPGEYNAYVLIDRESANLCQGRTAHDSIPIHVTIGRLQFRVDSILDRVCEQGEVQIYFTNSGSSITGDNATITFNDFATAAGFTSSNLVVDKGMFRITVPSGAPEGAGYGLKIALHTECGDDSVETAFTVPFDPNSLLVQRWDNVLGVKAQWAEEHGVVSYQWYKDDVKMVGETGSVLNLHDTTDYTGKYYVCMELKTGEQQCTCGKHFEKKSEKEVQLSEAELVVNNILGRAGQQYYVMTTEPGQASLYTVTGTLVSQHTLLVNGGYVELPKDNGFYVLKVEAGKLHYSVKVFVK